jgi:multidrug transporter EmrE-like cation transporter
MEENLVDASEWLSPRMLSFLTLLAAIAVNITGETTLKRGMNELGELHFRPATLAKTFTSPWIIVGFVLVFSAAVLWLRVISREPLSWAFPMLALGYLPLLYTSQELLGEHVAPLRWIGTLVIILGVTLVYRS